MSGISNHYDAMVEIQSIVKGIALVGLSAAPIIQEVLTYRDPDLPIPCVLIAPWGPERQAQDDDLVSQDSWGYGIAVVLVAHADNKGTNLEKRLGWREQLRRSLHNRALDALPPSYNLRAEPFNVVDVAAHLQDKKFVSGMVIRAFFQETRLP